MGFYRNNDYDDDDYQDDVPEYDVDDEEEDDEDEQRRSPSSGRVKPYSPGRSSSNLPGSRPSSSGGSSRPSYFSKSPSDSGSRPSGSSAPKDDARSRMFSNTGGSGSSSRGGSGSRGDTGSLRSGGTSGQRFGTGGSGGISRSSGGSGSSSSSRGDTGSLRSGGTSRPPGSSYGGRSDRDDNRPKSEPKKPDDENRGGRFSGITSRIPGGGGGKKDDKPAGDGEKKSGGGPLGGITSRIPGGGGGKKDDKPAGNGEKKSGGGPLGGITSRIPGGGGGKSDGGKSGGGGAATGVGAAVSGLSSRFRRGGGDDKKDDGPRASSSGAPGARPSSAGGIGSRPGSSTPGGGIGSRSGRPGGVPASSAQPGVRPPSAQSAPAKPEEAGGGLLGRITGSLPFGKSDKKPAKTSKTRAAKVPKSASEGMSLDTKLDILGVALVFGAFLLFLSSLSPDQGALTGTLNTFFGQVLGKGALAVPFAMLAIGVWLIVRHFGEDAPTIDPVRIVGLVMLYIGILIVLQYIESFNHADLEGMRIITLGRGVGGGWVGFELYALLVTSITEVGGMVVTLGWIVVSIMLLTRTSAAELAVLVISLWRSFQLARQRRAQRRQAERLAQEQLAAEAEISVSRPAPAELPGAAPAALPYAVSTEDDPDAIPIEERQIPIRMGGQMVNTELENAPAATQMPGAGAPPRPPATAQPGTPASQANRGLGARLRNAVPAALPFGSAKSDDESAKAPPAETAPAASQQGIPATPAPPPPTTLPGAAPPQPSAPASTPPSSSPASGTPGQSGTPAQPDQHLSRPADQPPAASSPFARPADQPAASAASSSRSEHTSSPAGQTPTHQAAQPAPGTDHGPAGSTASDGVDEDSQRIAAERQQRLNQLRSASSGQPPAAPTGSSPASHVQPASPSGQGNGSTPAQPTSPIPASASPTNGQQSANPAAESQPETAARAEPVINPTPAAAPTPQPVQQRRSWKMPDYRSVLSHGSEQDFDREALVKRARTIEDTLQSFGAPGRVVEINTGPVITQFGVEPDYLTARGGKRSRVKVSAIAQLDKDLQLALGAKAIRIEAPVPGKGFVGIEVPNLEASLVSLRDVMDSREFQRIKGPLAIALGQSVDGAPIAADLASMPHLLIAGTTGSGKSVCVNSIIASLLLRNQPEQVKFIMVDPKRVELTGYNGIPHLVAPVVVELERIVGVLKWVTREMDERYKKFSEAGARNIDDYNKHLPENQEIMPYIVVIIDELADLMMLAPDETERVITRIAALARATGIHLVIATQRPSVDVVTGLIKANFPARIAFAVASSVDSRVILDQPGAERLLGKGDMLYMSGNAPAPLRLQGVFVSDMEINNMNRYWRAQQANVGPQKPITLVMDDSPPSRARPAAREESASSGTTSMQQAFWDRTASETESASSGGSQHEDELYEEAVELVRRLNKASVSLLQRRLRIGYTRAARLIDVMEEEGIVGPPTEGSKPRDVLPFR